MTLVKRHSTYEEVFMSLILGAIAATVAAAAAIAAVCEANSKE
jgi:hypothetical protein